MQRCNLPLTQGLYPWWWLGLLLVASMAQGAEVKPSFDYIFLNRMVERGLVWDIVECLVNTKDVSSSIPLLRK